MGKFFAVVMIVFVCVWPYSNPFLNAGQPQADSLTKKQKLIQVLSRVTYGPSLVDLDHVRKIGIQKFMEEQLNPQHIDDSQCEQLLAQYSTLTLTAQQLYQQYPPAPASSSQNKTLTAKMVGQMEMSMKGDAEKAANEQKIANERLKKITDELMSAKVTRLVYSKRQLYEIMVDFWFNHFNVNLQKDNNMKWLMIPYEREVIRPHALGRFRDLLGAVAKSGAMLDYLDNAKSNADLRYVSAEVMDMPPPKPDQKQKNGLNENYARELMELHTLGVDGGYSQQDVIEAARILTGWGLVYPNPQGDPEDFFKFRFHFRNHDQGQKVVLGRKFDLYEGVQEGEKLLDMLCHQPATARFLATKLCRRFVCDNPPKTLVKQVAKRFLESGGDIKETLWAIFDSDEFYSPQYYKSKVKTPLEYVVSVLRESGAELKDPLRIANALNDMGEPFYQCEPPTGYPDVAKAWISSDTLLRRINFATMIMKNKKGPVFVDTDSLLQGVARQDGQKVSSRLYDIFLQGQISTVTRKGVLAAWQKQESSKKYSPDELAVLVLGSPDFQKR